MKLQFVCRIHHSDTIFTYMFAPDTPIAWQAGQSIRLEFDTLTGSDERRFTISSAPYEPVVSLTTQISHSNFKQRLAALRPGDYVSAGAISGTFTWPDTTWPFFVAGGMGITPYYAMLKQQIHEGKSLKATLLYANARPDVLFRSELDAWAKQHDDFTVVYTSCRQLMSHILSDRRDDRPIYISGPTRLVDRLGDVLVTEGIVTEPQLKRDWFTGYKSQM